MSTIILGIETSCDDTAAAVIVDGKLRANVVSQQLEHENYGGVIPELASRAHVERITAVVETSLSKANILIIRKPKERKAKKNSYANIINLK